MLNLVHISILLTRGRREFDRMVIGFTTTYATSAYHHKRYELDFRAREVYSIEHYVIKFVRDLRHVGGFLRVLRFTSTNKTGRHDMTEILLKVALSTTNQPTKQTNIILTVFSSCVCPQILELQYI